MSKARSSESSRTGSAAAVGAGVFAIAAVALLWYLFDVLLLVFGAVLLAVVIRAPTEWLALRTRLSAPWSLAIVLLLALLVFAFAGWFLGAALREQIQAVAEQVPRMLEQVQDYVRKYGWLEERIDPQAVIDDQGPNVLGRGLQVISATFGAAANVALVLFMAVLFAAQPDLYVRGVLHLVPKDRRARAASVMERIGYTLRRWMLGQFVLMLFVAACSVLGLWLLDIPYALALGLVAGLLTFVPFFGPLLAAGIAVLVSLAQGVIAAVSVGLLYLGVQIIEGLLEPIVQQRAVYLPPVLLLVSQLTLGVLVGVLGVILATPLAAAVLVIVQMLYVQDVLDDRTLEND